MTACGASSCSRCVPCSFKCAESPTVSRQKRLGLLQWADSNRPLRAPHSGQPLCTGELCDVDERNMQAEVDERKMEAETNEDGRQSWRGQGLMDDARDLVKGVRLERLPESRRGALTPEEVKAEVGRVDGCVDGGGVGASLSEGVDVFSRIGPPVWQCDGPDNAFLFGSCHPLSYPPSHRPTLARSLLSN